jgi:hypothetical protein
MERSSQEEGHMAQSKNFSEVRASPDEQPSRRLTRGGGTVPSVYLVHT